MIPGPVPGHRDGLRPAAIASCDVVIVGLGPAGATYARQRASAGERVLVIDRETPHPPGTFERLSAACARHLIACGVMMEGRTPCAGTVFRWGDGHYREQWHSGEDQDWVVDKEQLSRGFRDTMRRGGIPVMRGDLRQVDRSPGGVSVTFRDGRTVEQVDAARVVFAHGRAGRHPPRRRTGASTRSSTLIAFVTRATGPVPGLGNRLLVDAADEGYWYAIGNGHAATIGFITDAAQLNGRRGEDLWASAVRRADWLPTWAHHAPVRGRPCITHARLNAEVLLLGDAALALDPLSGHGLAVAAEGAVRASADPTTYNEWLTFQTRTHLFQQQQLYALVDSNEGFWVRRRAPAGV